MKYRTILGLLIVAIICSCSQRTTKGKQQIVIDPNKHLRSHSGLLIENGNDQGLTHTDPLGTKYKYLYNTSIITNDNTMPVHLQIAISNEYDNPAYCADGKYKLFLLPEELTPDSVTLWNNIFAGLHNFLDSCLDSPYRLNKTLEPGEKHVVTIGRLFSRPATCGVLPNALIAQGDSLFFGTGSCSVLIPCGHISYIEQ